VFVANLHNPNEAQCWLEDEFIAGTINESVRQLKKSFNQQYLEGAQKYNIGKNSKVIYYSFQ